MHNHNSACDKRRILQPTVPIHVVIAGGIVAQLNRSDNALPFFEGALKLKLAFVDPHH
jgi:hypothetical protein